MLCVSHKLQMSEHSLKMKWRVCFTKKKRSSNDDDVVDEKKKRQWNYFLFHEMTNNNKETSTEERKTTTTTTTKINKLTSKRDERVRVHTVEELSSCFMCHFVLCYSFGLTTRKSKLMWQKTKRNEMKWKREKKTGEWKKKEISNVPASSFELNRFFICISLVLCTFYAIALVIITPLCLWCICVRV